MSHVPDASPSAFNNEVHDTENAWGGDVNADYFDGPGPSDDEHDDHGGMTFITLLSFFVLTDDVQQVLSTQQFQWAL